MFDFFDWLDSTVADMANAVANAIAIFFNFIIGATFSVMMFLIDLLPDINWPFSASDVSSLHSALSTWNMFFPITETVLLSAFYLSYIFLFSTIKIVVKLIPTVG